MARFARQANRGVTGFERAAVAINHKYTGPRPLAVAMAKAVAETRLRRKARQLYDRPPRLTVEAIVALAELHGDLQAAEHIVDQILAVSDDALDVLDCRDVPLAPIHIVDRG